MLDLKHITINNNTNIEIPIIPESKMLYVGKKKIYRNYMRYLKKIPNTKKPITITCEKYVIEV